VNPLIRFGWTAVLALGSLAVQTRPAENPDDLYRARENLSSAARAADLWAQRSATEFDAAWKLSRACYWLGTHLPEQSRRSALDRGVSAGSLAVRLAAGRPEGHFWLAANMGRLAESFGVIQALRFRSRIRAELERVIAIDGAWQGGDAEAALGQWYAEVPRFFGGSRDKAEEHLRRALGFDASNMWALSFLAEMMTDDGKVGEARTLLQRVIDAPFEAEWVPEQRELKEQATVRLKALRR
jgi:hypothetical protein